MIIPLTLGHFTEIDNNLAEIILNFKWNASISHYKSKQMVYARASPFWKKPKVLLHRFVMEISISRELVKGEEIDHIDGNTLNNKRENLRICNRSQNLGNQPRQKRCKCKYKGVVETKDRFGRVLGYTARVAGKYIGFYKTQEDAGLAYDKAAIEHYGVFAKVNF